MGRKAIALVSSKNLRHNVEILKKRSHGSGFVAMVKANAYGHGIRSSSLRLREEVDYFGVASINEALALRHIGITTPILLAEGIFSPQELDNVHAHNLAVVCHNEQQCQWLLQDERGSSALEVWLKIDTGMHRLGFAPERCAEIYAKLTACNHIKKPLVLMSHLACSEEKDHPMNAVQIACFAHTTASFRGKKSLCNSAGIIHFPEQHYDYVRAGLMVYGVSPIEGTSAKDLGLRPVMTLESEIIALKEVTEGAYIGYGARFRARRTLRLGIVALGYGDGYPISASDGTPVRVRTTFCPVVGRVAMDMFAIDVSSCKGVTLGDTVTLWGEGLPLETVAQHMQIIPWSLLTGVQNRVAFVWDDAVPQEARAGKSA